MNESPITMEKQRLFRSFANDRQRPDVSRARFRSAEDTLGSLKIWQWSDSWKLWDGFSDNSNCDGNWGYLGSRSGLAELKSPSAPPCDLGSPNSPQSGLAEVVAGYGGEASHGAGPPMGEELHDPRLQGLPGLLD
ncbi:hypothetical protein TIFTF001_026552 [Ficus carica]|uniref:Uncharacterized protein n=1 Tax=Ficus carica TaxID=3494 RepID=A0AA88IYV5_FICCA|nr:hypothetical protein TIFTF001_026552 [Ficus carica]